MIWLIFLLACNSPQPEEIPHDQGLTQKNLIFKTVEKLGPHKFYATISREEYRDDKLVSLHQEITEIIWQDWDNFSFKRMVDSKVVENVIVVDREAWMMLPNQVWKKQKDAYSHRVDMRRSWNVWEQLLKPFYDGLVFTKEQRAEIDSRPVDKYSLSYSNSGKIKNAALTPVSIAGLVWVDIDTTVRLFGEVEGVRQKGDYRKEFFLQFERSNIGEEIVLNPPK